MSDKQLLGETLAITTSARPTPDWEKVSWLPCAITAELPLLSFTVGDLLRLESGQVLQTGCHRGSEIPVRVNGQLIGCAELESVGEHIAMRITALN
jgi:flagellar motor switch/type III secretory pathway protein FliN